VTVKSKSMSVCLVALPFLFAADATAELLQRREARECACEDRYDEVLTERRMGKSSSGVRTSRVVEAIQAYTGNLYGALGLIMVIASSMSWLRSERPGFSDRAGE
jgi:hypothetical protein